MASSDGLRIGKASLGSVAVVALAIISAAAAHTSQLAERIGSLERQVAAIESRHDAEQKSTLHRLDHITDVVEKIRDRLDQ